LIIDSLLKYYIPFIVSYLLLGVLFLPDVCDGLCISILIFDFDVGLVPVDDAQEDLAGEGDQPALGDCLHRELPRAIVDQSQLAEVVALFVVLVERLFCVIFSH
jgi:hypothetical protein